MEQYVTLSCPRVMDIALVIPLLARDLETNPSSVVSRLAIWLCDEKVN